MMTANASLFDLNIPYNLWGVSIAIGLALAIDVSVLTISRFRERRSFFSWSLPAGVLHSLLLAIGLLLWRYAGNEFGSLSAPLGFLALGLVLAVVYEMICNWLEMSPLFSISNAFNISSSKIIILTVSMDAFWSGPAISAKANYESWNFTETVAFLITVGVVVTIVAQVSLYFAAWLRSKASYKVQKLSRQLVFAKFLEATVLMSFGILSIWFIVEPFMGRGSLWKCVIISAIPMSLIWKKHYSRFYSVQLSEFE